MKERKRIYLSGNKGGDYVAIFQTEEQEEISCCTIEVGHCCVVILSGQVPVEFLTSLFFKFMLFKPDGMSRSTEDKLSDFAAEVMTYMDKDFVVERLSKIST
jgi:hypothetical protein